MAIRYGARVPLDGHAHEKKGAGHNTDSDTDPDADSAVCFFVFHLHSDLAHMSGFLPALGIDDIENDLVSPSQRAEALHLDGAVMYKKPLAFIGLNESIAFVFMKDTDHPHSHL